MTKVGNVGMCAKKDITHTANIKMNDSGEVKLEKVTNNNGDVNYYLIVKPKQGYKLKEIKVGQTKLPTMQKKDNYILKDYIEGKK